MLFDITHQTDYAFSRPVYLEPHTLRFHPRSDGAQWLESYELSITPEPQGLTHMLDAEGNTVAVAWFDGLHDRLSISARIQAQTLRENPFDFLLDSPRPAVPCSYPESLGWLLAPARHRKIQRCDADPIHDFVTQLRRQSDDVLSFLTALNQALYNGIEVIHREIGEPRDPAETLTTRRGACRDLAMLFVDACRAMGLAARFVSGYQEGDRDQTQRELHAWAEVYLPGAGWRGFDPTHGLAVSDRHLVLAAASDPKDAAPVVGHFRGNEATSTMTARITVHVAESITTPPQNRQQQQQTA